jgi:hypothetical protein
MNSPLGASSVASTPYLTEEEGEQMELTDLAQALDLNDADGIYECSTCQKRFQKLVSLRSHEVTHSSLYRF